MRNNFYFLLFGFLLSKNTVVIIKANPMISMDVKGVFNHTKEKRVAATGSILASILAFTAPISCIP